jgi:alpha-1,3-rhamnosyltransferase
MNQLVSVIIPTFNSAHYLIETLESVFNQTWKDIELIITDDASVDDTVEVSKRWLEENKGRFIESRLLLTESNTGVSANLNRGLKVANGAWIKFLGADDTLKTTFIEDNMEWVSNHSESFALFSKIEVYKNTFESENLIDCIPQDPFHVNGLFASNKDAVSQYKMLLMCDRIHFTPSVFLNKKALLDVGGFDERFKLLEDYPLWLSLTKNGYRLFFMDKVTVNYRQHSKAINNTGVKSLIHPNYFKQEGFRRIYTYPFLPVDVRFSQRFCWYVSQIFRIEWLNKDNEPSRLFHYLLTKVLNPFKYLIMFRKYFNSELSRDEFYLE